MHLWLRSEVKANEHRTALTPEACKELLGEGYTITVERSPEASTKRIYEDSDYEAVGCQLAESQSWPSAPKDAIIVGLKELPEDGSPLEHTHLYFGHCYKNQGGWKDLLKRFHAGNGSLLDMEFLTNDQGRRVAAFGYMAGFAGSFSALDVWCHRKLEGDKPYGALSAYPNEDELLKYSRARIEAAAAKNDGRLPRVLVIGALGRCGNGACDFATRAGIPEANVLRWDMAETKVGGPFNELLDVDIFVNCIYLSQPIPPFITEAMLEKEDRALSVVCDVSCDTSNPHNPIPFANKSTTFDEPTYQVKPKVGGPVDVITIDHLPTLLPKESSDRYCHDLLPSIRELKNMDSNPVWQRAIKLFEEKKALALA